jgi:hypothetical protein
MKRHLLRSVLSIMLGIVLLLSQPTSASANNKCSYVMASGTIPANQYNNPTQVATFTIAGGDGVHVIATNSSKGQLAGASIEITHFPYPTSSDTLGSNYYYNSGVPTVDITLFHRASLNYNNVFVNVSGQIPAGQKAIVSYTVYKLSDCYSVSP